MLFPGASRHWSKDPGRFVTLARSHSVHCVAELSFAEGARYTTYRAGRADLDALRIVQQLRDSAQANKEPGKVDQVVRQCEPGGVRRIAIAGQRVGVLVCGENNVLRSVQSQANRCDGVRGHPGRPLLEDVDIILNGAHTIMGNWGKLNNRFEWLSRGGRTLAYTTNNDMRAWKSALRVFHDGQRVADGDAISPSWNGGPFEASLLRDVRHDEYRIVLMDRN